MSISVQLSVCDDDGVLVSTHQLDSFPCKIGRAKDNDVVLPGWRVGKTHAQIQRSERILRLIDCGTLNGTWVNGQRITDYAPLNETDEIVFAGYRLRIVEVDSSAPVAAAQTTGSEAVESGMPSVTSSPSVSPDATRAVRRDLHQQLIRTIDLRRKDIRQLSNDQLRAELTTLLVELIAQYPRLPVDIDQAKLLDELLSEALGLGPLDLLLADASVSEIMVNCASEVFVERRGVLELHHTNFSSDEAVRAIIDRIVQPLGRRIDEASPMVDARLPDGSRVNAIIPPLALRGPSITIRKFNRKAFTPQSLVTMGSLSEPMLAFLKVCVVQRKNVIVSGGTGSGKTTLLNVLSSLIPEHERIVTIEDAAELKLNHRNLVTLEARPSNVEGRGAVTIRDLVRNSLRMRPDRIVVGEVRGGEALDMLQAMNTGHDGSLTTVHANSARDVFSRLEVMSLMAGIDLPLAALREQICSAVDIIVHQSRLIDGARRITSILEVTGIESGRIQAQEIFRYQATEVVASHGQAHGSGAAASNAVQPISVGTFQALGAVPTFYESLSRGGLELDYRLFERVHSPSDNRSEWARAAG